MSELVRSVAFVFRRKGADALAAQDFVNVLSFDLRWFSPSDAKRLLALATERKLVVREGDVVRAGFPLDAVEVPVGFRPGPGALVEPPEATTPPTEAPRPWPTLPPEDEPAAAPDPLLAKAAELAGIPAETLRAEAEHERERAAGLLDSDAALVLAVARRGHDVAALAREARGA